MYKHGTYIYIKNPFLDPILGLEYNMYQYLLRWQI